MIRKQNLGKDNHYPTFHDTQFIYSPQSSGARNKNRERDYLRMVSRQREAEQLAMQFCEFIGTWDSPVRQALNELAQVRWPSQYFLKLIPVSTYRLRDHQVAAQLHLWWVEHDIPPYDKYQCASYQVYLTVNNEENEPMLFVQSGSKVYPVTPLTEKNLKVIVAQAGQDQPIVITRNMGKANY